MGHFFGRAVVVGTGIGGLAVTGAVARISVR
jgi:hypothetical protein